MERFNTLADLRMRTHVALNKCGRINLKTGENAHFNVLLDWNETDHVTVFHCPVTDEKILIGGTCAVGTKERFRDSQTNRELLKGHTFVSILSVACTKANLEVLRGLHGNSMKFYTYD